MIKITNNNKGIIACWQEAFGDSEEDIRFFIDNVKKAVCLANEVGSDLASMLFLVPCTINGEQGHYIYAACTKRQYQKQSRMTKLLDAAFEKEDNFLCLLPADEALVKFYCERGFTAEAAVESLGFCQSEAIKEYLFDGCRLTKPFVMIRKKGE